tara:strand:+ start:22023 stop:22241 length:219 start_codon:yes stop_codon:yes gene_type:complete
MTKKNYIKLVEIINNNKEKINYNIDKEPLERIDFVGFIYNLAKYLKEDNPNFDEQKFYDAVNKNDYKIFTSL